MPDDRLVIAAQVDATGVSRGLTQAVRLVEQSGERMQRAWGGFQVAPETLLPQNLPAAAAAVGERSGEAYRAAFLDQLERLGDAGGRLQSIGNRLSIAITAPVVGFGGLSVKLAADAIESASRFEQVFGSATASAQAALDRLYPTVFATTAGLQDMTSDIGAMVRGFGASGPVVSQFSTDVVRLAGDLASFNNLAVDDVLTALRAGLVGETEPLRRFGVALSETGIQAEAMRLGFLEQGETLTALGRAQAAYSLILQGTVSAQGDAARTAGSASNQFKNTTRNLRELSTTIGQQLLPQLVPLASSLSSVLTEVNKLNPETIQLGIKVAAVGAAIGPVLTGVGTLAIGFSGLARAAIAARVAVTGLAGTAALGRLAAISAPIAVGVGAIAVGLHKFDAGARRAAEGAEAFISATLPKMDVGELETTITNERMALEQMARNREALIGRINAAGLTVDVADPTKFQQLMSPMVHDLAVLNTQIENGRTVLGAVQAQYEALGGAAGQAGTEAADFAAELRASFDTTLAGIQGSLGSLSIPSVNTKGAETALEAFRTRAEATLTRLNVATTLGAGQTERLALVQDVVRAEAEVTAEIERRGGARAQDIQAVDRLVRTLGTLRDATRLEVAITVPPVDLSAIKLPTIRVDPAWGQLTDAADAYVAKARRAARETDKLADALGQVSSAARGVKGLAGLFGGMDEGVGQALDGVFGMIDGFEALARAKSASQEQMFDNPFEIPSGFSDFASKLPGMIGVIGGAVGIVSSLFNRGPSALEIAMDKNREALNKLSANINNVRPSFANLGQASTAARVVASNPALLELGFRGPMGQLDGARLAEQLSRLGTNFAELSDLAEQFGLTLQDSKGRALTPLFEQFAEAMDLARKSALQLGDSFRDLQQQSAVRMDLFNLDGPADAWAAAVEQAQRLLPAQIAAQIAGLEIDDQAGQDAARSFIQGLFTQASAGGLTDTLFASGFENIGEFFDFLVTLEDPLDQLGTAAKDAASALSDINVPAGFRKTLAEWASTLPTMVDLVPTAPVVPFTPPPAPPRVPLPPTGRDRTSTGDATGRDRVVTNMSFGPGSVVIQGTGKSAEQLFTEIEEVGRRRARGAGGPRAASRYTLAAS